MLLAPARTCMCVHCVCDYPLQAKRLRGQFLADYRRVVGDVPGMTSDEAAVEALTAGVLKGHTGDVELAFTLGHTLFAQFTPQLKVMGGGVLTYTLTYQ